MDETSDCHNDDHIIKEFEQQDFQVNSFVKIDPAVQFEISSFTNEPIIEQTPIVELGQLMELSESPPRILYQQFLC